MSKSYAEFLLREKFPTQEDLMTELINLEAIQQLPKGTELYISDIHGEYEAFDHILRIGSGNVKEKITELFHDELNQDEIEQLTLIVAYPEYAFEKDPIFETKDDEQIIDLIERLTIILKFSSAKYTRSKLRKALPEAYTYVIEELLYADYALPHKKEYAREIMKLIIKLDKVKDFIFHITSTIQNLVIDRLHVVGDVFDRGPDADRVMDRLMTHPSVDIQWGNHDMLWVGAYYGSVSSLMTLLRIAARYNYIFDLEYSYGLNLRPLFIFAKKFYDENSAFTPKGLEDKRGDEHVVELEQVHQALSIIQFKLEEQLLARRPEFNMDHRKLLQSIDYEQNTIVIEGKAYSLDNPSFQTIDPENPMKLTVEEEEVVESLMYSYQNSTKVGQHIQFFVDNGSNYLIYNNHLLYHGCMPLNEDGDFAEMSWQGRTYKGKSLLEFFDDCVEKSRDNRFEREDFYTDMYWYIWCGPLSPLFGKDKMTTFERYYVADKATHHEEKNPYFVLRDKRETAEMILREFGLYDERSAIINGHTPVKAKKGEDPIKAEGKLFVIDGGLSEAYHGTTGIAGYSLLNNSFGFQVVTHMPFVSIKDLFEKQFDGTYVKKVVEKDLPRVHIRETSTGEGLQEQINVIRKYIT